MVLLTISHDLVDKVGTSFMIAFDLLMTNDNVNGSQAAAAGVTVTFNYQLDRASQECPVQVVRAHPAGFFYTNAAFDFTVVQLVAAPNFGAPLAHLAATGRVDRLLSPLLNRRRLAARR